jgi:hypothetical protein
MELTAFWRTAAAVILSLATVQSAFPQTVDDGLTGGSAGAVIGAPAAPVFELPAGYVGPPLPVPPAVVTRDPEGRAAVRAVRLSQPLPRFDLLKNEQPPQRLVGLFALVGGPVVRGGLRH